MRYRLRTLLILMAVVPPVIGFWPGIKRRVVNRATQVNACDVAVVAATASMIAIRARVHLAQAARATEEESAATCEKMV